MKKNLDPPFHMNCLRCDGLMVYEEFCDFQDTLPCFWGWRCILCGEILDPLILAHRTGNGWGQTRKTPPASVALDEI